MNRSIFVAGYPQRAHTQHMRVLLTFWYFENSKSAQTCSVLFEWLVKYWLVQTKAILYQEYCLLLKHHCLTFLLKISIHHESSNRFNLDQKASILWFLVELENWKKNLHIFTIHVFISSICPQQSRNNLVLFCTT